jgi:hypothetical protein
MIFKDRTTQETFDRQGYAVIRFLQEDHVAALLNLYRETVASDPMKDLYESSRANTLEKNVYINSEIRKLFAGPAEVFFMNGELFGGTFMVKVPRASSVLPLHQDRSIVEEDRHQSAFIWCALCEIGPENGGLFVLPGSHAWFENYRSGSMPSVRIQPQGALKESLLDIHMSPGDAVVYSDRLFHGSHSNAAADSRIVVTGRVNENGSRLVYYHKSSPDSVVVVQASPEFYLKEIDALAKGQLPPGYTTLRTISYIYRPVTATDLMARVC